MRLGTLATNDGSRAAVILDDRAVMVDGHPDVGALLRDPNGLTTAAALAEGGGPTVTFKPHELLRPVLSPGAIVCVGLNYRAHILEMGRELPADPTLFAKLPRALTDPYADIEMPDVSDRIDYEAELAVVIGKRGRNIRARSAWAHVAGLTIINDVTARDFQRRTLQWFAGKTFQASTPVGPWIVTTDELSGLEARAISLTVNGEERQRSLLGDLVFDVPALIADLSRIVELEPGDIIATGTPGGVGEPEDRFLHDGDEVAVRIDGIGEIRNTFKRERA
jgi:acylpyruvate hydrolase